MSYNIYRITADCPEKNLIGVYAYAEKIEVEKSEFDCKDQFLEVTYLELLLIGKQVMDKIVSKTSLSYNYLYCIQQDLNKDQLDEYLHLYPATRPMNAEELSRITLPLIP